MLTPVFSLVTLLCCMTLGLTEDTSTNLHDDTRGDLRDIISRMEKLENDGKVQEQLLREQRTDLQQLRDVVNNQNARLLYQNTLIKAFTKRVSSLERQLASLQHVDTEPESVPDDTVGSMDNPDPVQMKGKSAITKRRATKERIRQARAASGQPVAFFAEFHGAGQTNIGLNQNIVFPDVTTNLGNGYHNHHGVFIAPQGGVYIFSTSIMALYDGFIDFNIMLNGRRLASSLAVGNNASHNGQGSVTVVSQLAVGDEVWVSLREPVGTAITGDDYSSFTGCLVTPI